MKQKVLHDDSLKGIKFYEAFQKPGDVIYVPGTWWHGVVNMSDAVAVTQNFCGYVPTDCCPIKTTSQVLMNSTNNA